MFGGKPEKYVSLDPAGNNLENDLPTLRNLLSKLNKSSVSYKLIILIGNTDPYYIYTQSGKTTPYTKKEFLIRFNRIWSKYKDNLTKWLNDKLSKGCYEVVSWYDLEKQWEKDSASSFEKLFTQTKVSINRYFTNSELNWEISKLENAFGKDQYFGLLPKPNKQILTSWVKRKFAEYSVQGLWIKQIYPEAILVQNEKPSDLRYKMYQPLIERLYKSRLPNIFPFGVDNLSYQ